MAPGELLLADEQDLGWRNRRPIEAMNLGALDRLVAGELGRIALGRLAFAAERGLLDGGAPAADEPHCLVILARRVHARGDHANRTIRRRRRQFMQGPVGQFGCHSRGEISTAAAKLCGPRQVMTCSAAPRQLHKS